MFLTVALVTFINTLPIAFSMCVSPDFALWEEGYFEIIASKVGGWPLRVLLAIGSCVCLLSELNVLLLVTAKAIAVS
jgi:hypothetical protein